GAEPGLEIEVRGPQQREDAAAEDEVAEEPAHAPRRGRRLRSHPPVSELPPQPGRLLPQRGDGWILEGRKMRPGVRELAPQELELAERGEEDTGRFRARRVLDRAVPLVDLAARPAHVEDQGQ